ncbi:MAG: MarR family transcriptional regulator [Oscillospiraceae bacterium]|nr:MarR family transcriptional regulator [Oscillospiraceae bacterium]
MIQRFERFSLAIFEISRCWHKLAAEELAPYGLKGAHAIYLTAMYRCGEGVTGPQLCELCGRDKSDVSRAVAILQEKGFVTKEVVNQSLYRGLFKLTERGKDAAQQIGERASLAVELAGGDLTEKTREAFYEALCSIAARLHEISKEGLPQK